MPTCIHFADGWKELWEALFSLAEISKKDPGVRSALTNSNTVELVEAAVNAHAAPANKPPFVAPNNWTFVFGENVRYFLMVPNNSDGLTVYVPLDPIASPGPLNQFPPLTGNYATVAQRVEAWLAPQVHVANTTAKAALRSAAADCAYGCHSETSPIWRDELNRIGTDPVGVPTKSGCGCCKPKGKLTFEFE